MAQLHGLDGSRPSLRFVSNSPACPHSDHPNHSLEDEVMARGRGQPTAYRPEYCEMLVEHCAKGLSIESFAAVVDVCEDTIYEWAKVHPEFSEAKKRAKPKSRLFWEKAGIEGLHSVTRYDSKTGKPTESVALNSSVWIFNMKHRFQWRDKPEEESGLDDSKQEDRKSPGEYLEMLKARKP